MEVVTELILSIVTSVADGNDYNIWYRALNPQANEPTQGLAQKQITAEVGWVWGLAGGR